MAPDAAPWQVIEARFLARRARRPDPAGALAGAAARVGLSQPLLRAGRAIAAALDDWSRAHGELPYHNRHHAAEAALAMAELCAKAMALGLLSPDEAGAGVAAMLGHDLGHDGRLPGGGVLEACAGTALAALAAAEGVDDAQADLMAAVVRATDPALAPGNAARAAGLAPPGPGGRSHDLLFALANEADICASLLPRLGPRLGRALEREWRRHAEQGVPGAGSQAGRLAFLRAVPPFSRPATVLGLDAAHAASLSAIA